MIVIGDYGFEPDSHGWKLGKVSEQVDKETGGRRTVLVSTVYPSSVQSLIGKLLEYRMRDADAESLEDLAAEVERFRAELSSIFTIKVSV